MRHALLLALCVSLPAAARRHHPRAPPGPPPARPEDDVRRKGDNKAFARARVRFAAPADLAQVDPDEPLRIVLEVQGYALGAPRPGAPAPHLHLIVDNEPAFQVDDAVPLLLGGLPPGPHLLRAVLCRPWHEVVKAKDAFALARIWVGEPLRGKAGKAAEYVAWPDPKKPLVTYVLPIGAASPGAPQLKLAVDRGQDPDEAGFDQLPPPSPGADRPVLDFYLSRVRLARRGDKLRVVLDRRELPLVTEWKPQHLRRARPGAHRLTIDLLNRRGLKVKNAVNRTDRAFSFPPAG